MRMMNRVECAAVNANFFQIDQMKGYYNKDGMRALRKLVTLLRAKRVTVSIIRLLCLQSLFFECGCSFFSPAGHLRLRPCGASQ